MATFEAQTMVDPNPGVNALYNAQQGQWIQNQQNQNALLQSQQAFPVKLQAAQQAVGLTDWDAAARAGTALLGMSEDQAAAAYPGMLQGLRAQGFKLPDAPATYPGHAAIQAMVNRGMTVPQQYASGIIMPPGLADTLGRITGTQPAGTTATSSTGGGAPGTIEPAALTSATAVRDGLIKRGMDPVTATAFAANKLHESGATLDSGPGDGGASQGNFMWNGDRNTEYQQLYGHTPQGAPLDEQLDFVMHELNGKESAARDAINAAQGVDGKAAAISQYYLRPRDVVPEAQRRSATALQLQRQLAATAPQRGQGGATAPGVAMGDATRPDLAPPPPGGTAGIPGPYQATGGGIGSVLGGTTRAATPAGPAGPPIVTDQPAGGAVVAGPPGTAVVGAPTPPSAAVPGNVSAINAGITRAGGAPVAAAQAEPGWGTGIGQYGPQNTLAPPAPPRPQVAPAATPPAATPPPTGVNSPQYQQALQLQNEALQVETMYPNSPQAKAAAAALRLRAQQILQTDSVVQTPQGQVHTLTGKIDDPAKPLPHYVYDPTQHAYIDTTGTNKPEFEPAQRDSAVAQRDVMELGPLVANNTATPEQVARYNVAATTYQQPTLRENPVTKETVRVNTRELPPGFPQPSGPGTGGAPGGAGGGGSSQTVLPGYSPAQQQVERDPAAYKVAESQYDRDSKEIAGIADAGRGAQADQIRINEMQDVLQRFTSGSGTDARTAAASFLQRWLPASLTGWEKQSANLSGADAAQAFAKLALTGAGTAERSVLGNRGGFQAIRMFQAANPNVDLNDATNNSILNMQLISNQANQDYSQAAQAHFAENERNFGSTHQYKSLAQFDTAWNAQRNPQVYAAAMGAIGGQPASQWTKGLSDDEYTRALQIVQRAKPSAVVQTKNGPYSMQPAAVTSGTSGKPGTTVIRFDHNGNVIPGP